MFSRFNPEAILTNLPFFYFNLLSGHHRAHPLKCLPGFAAFLEKVMSDR